MKVKVIFHAKGQPCGRPETVKRDGLRLNTPFGDITVTTDGAIKCGRALHYVLCGVSEELGRKGLPKVLVFSIGEAETIQVPVGKAVVISSKGFKLCVGVTE